MAILEKPHLANLDPRTGLILGFAGLGAVLAATRLETVGIQSSLVLLLLLATGLSAKWARSMRLLWPTLALVFVVVYLSFDSREALFSTGKLFNLLSISFIFFSKISPEEMTDALRKMHVPYAFSFILATAMRYVPLMRQKTRNIMDAQLSRGIDLHFRPRNIKNILALVVPLTVQSFMLSEQLAMAMEMRGFSRGRRTCRRSLHLTWLDHMIIVSSLILLIAFTWWERGGHWPK